MTNLPSEKEQLLQSVYDADQQHRLNKINAKAMAKEYEARLLRDSLAQRDLRVRVAFDAGIPARQIHVVGLSTTSRKTLDDSLTRTTRRSGEEGQL